MSKEKEKSRKRVFWYLQGESKLGNRDVDGGVASGEWQRGEKEKSIREAQ